jgi:hypothetical protein
MKKTLLACASVFALLPTTSAAVPTVYTYTGQPYTNIHDDIVPTGSYTTDMRISGSLTLRDALGPDADVTVTNIDELYDPLRGDLRPLSFRFTDGREVYDSTSDRIIYTFFRFDTDSSGMVETWDIYLASEPRSVPDAQHAHLNSGTPPCVNSFGCDHVDIETEVEPRDLAGTFANGTWTVTPVPEPESYALFLAGIALLGFVAKRRMWA